jgi:hypothetical protein
MVLYLRVERKYSLYQNDVITLIRIEDKDVAVLPLHYAHIMVRARLESNHCLQLVTLQKNNAKRAPTTLLSQMWERMELNHRLKATGTR